MSSHTWLRVDAVRERRKGHRTIKPSRQVGNDGHHAAAHHVGWEDATSRDDSATRSVLSAVKVEPSELGGQSGRKYAGQEEAVMVRDRAGQSEAYVVSFCLCFLSFASLVFPVMEIEWMWIGRADPSRSTQPESLGLGCLADVLILYSVHASSCRA